MAVKSLRIALLGAAAICSGCAGISLSDEVDELKTASGSFGESLRTLHSSLPGGPVAARRAIVEDFLISGSRVTFSEGCRDSVIAANDAFNTELRLAEESSYRQAFVDRAYRQIHMVSLCDLTGLSEPSLALVPPLPENGGSIAERGAPGADTLAASSRALDRYVRALADLASNTSGAAHDQARNAVFEAGGALLTALGVPLAAPVAGLLGQLVASVEQARRNGRIAEYLRG